MPDRDVIVTKEGSGVGALVGGILAALLILLAIWYFGVRGNGDDADVNIDVDVPGTVAPDNS